MNLDNRRNRTSHQWTITDKRSRPLSPSYSVRHREFHKVPAFFPRIEYTLRNRSNINLPIVYQTAPQSYAPFEPSQNTKLPASSQYAFSSFYTLPSPSPSASASENGTKQNQAIATIPARYRITVPSTQTSITST